MTDALTFLHCQTPSQFTRKASRGSVGMYSTRNDRKRSKLIDFSGLVAFLRAAHPYKTCEEVEARSGVPACTVRKWLSGETHPNGAALCLVFLEYGPEAFAACVTCAPRWLKAAVRAEMTERLKAQIAADQRTLKELTDL